MSLTARIVGLVTLAALLSSSLVGFLAIRNSRNALENQVLVDSQTQADLGAQFISRYMDNAQTALTELTTQVNVGQVVAAGQGRNMQSVLAIFNRIQPQFQNVLLYDADGNALARADESLPSTRVFERDWFQGAMTTGVPYLSLPLIGASSGRAVVVYAIPLYFEGRFQGMLAASLSLVTLTDALSFANQNPDITMALVDLRQGGLVLAHPDASQIFQPYLGTNADSSLLLSGERRTIATERRDGEGLLVAVTPVSDLPWSLVVEQSSATAFAPIGRLTRNTLLVLAPIILLACLLSAWLALQISRPVHRLLDAVQGVAEGDLTRRVGLTQRDEIGELGRAYDNMADALAQRRHERELAMDELSRQIQVRHQAEAELRKAHDEMESRVRERTAELATSNQSLLETMDELKRSNAELEQFAYVASHDLQEPLRMVSNYTQLLSRRYGGQLDDDADTFIGFAVEGAGRMQHLINDLLEFSRVGTRGGDLRTTDMESTLQRALFNLRQSIEEAGAVVDHDPLPPVLGDDSQLTQLLQNLIGNAIKFRGERTPHIEVSAVRADGQWQFCVRDNGIGIEPQYWDRIFVIFQRLHGRGEYAGTGIGLALCRRIVERHGGRIWLDSAPGEGTSFYFTLTPAIAERQAVEPPLAAPEAA